MATIAPPAARPKPISPDLFERILAYASIVLIAFVAVAIARGRHEWAEVPMIVWAHIVTILVALVLTPIMLLRRRGDRRHRHLGWVWIAAMFFTALLSFGIRYNNGGFSWIHLLSVWTLIQVPVIAWSARTHNVKQHRGSVRGMVLGALLIAGFFTFPFNRLMGHWLFATETPAHKA